MNKKVNKIIHYLTLMLMILLLFMIIFDEIYFYIFCMNMGIHFVNRGFMEYKKVKQFKLIIFAGVVIFLIGLLQIIL